MNKSLFPMLLCAALLCGCAAQNSTSESAPSSAIAAPAAAVSNTLSISLLSQSQAMEEYALSEPVRGFAPMEDSLLFFSGAGETALTLFHPETGSNPAFYQAPIPFTPENAAVQFLETGISYFHAASAETVILDASLQEIHRIPAPEGLSGIPLLSQDGRTLYYCTASAIRCLDLDSGISRILKETAHPSQSVSALLLQDSILQLGITDSDGACHTLFLSTENGQLMGDYPGNLSPETTGSYFFLCLQDGNLATFLCGTTGSASLVFNPLKHDGDCFFLGRQVVTATQAGDGIQLDLYDLESGLRTASITGFPGTNIRSAVRSEDGRVWLLCSEEDESSLLYCWNPTATPVQDHAVYTAPYYTRENPDYDGLAACSLLAREISEKYGIDVRIYKDAAALEPWDYHLEYEYQAAVLQRELEALDRRLSSFPSGFLETLAQKFTALKICIVRSVEGSPESGSLEAVNGIQFMDGFDAYIVLASDHNTEYALYHELSHLMETVVLTESSAYDRWENLNPEGFQYDNDYILNQTRDGSSWLKPGSEYFIDTYAMSYAKEDRARLLEYAMTEGHTQLFSSPNLQRKLLHMCGAIREAFGLTNAPEPFLWEQYLHEPIVPQK